jgi:hypothetical protein
VAASTWNRELAMVSGFFAWAMRQRLVESNPVPMRVSRDHGRRRAGGDSEVPAARARDAAGDRVEWLTPEQYRRWRDSGLRGYQPGGLSDGGFRGRWANRNALFADVMVRTELRLAEQASLTILGIPHNLAGQGYQRFWLPGAIAKNESARWVYLPAALARKTGEYITADRASVIAAARARGAYDTISDPLVIEDPDRGPRAVARRPGGDGAGVRLERLSTAERSRLLIRGRGGLEPAVFWLGEHGMPVSLSGWKDIFRSASARCERAGVPVTCHPHMLRHRPAVRYG